MTKECEEIAGLCSSLSQERALLRTREQEQRDKWESTRKEKLRLVRAGEKEASQQRVKIKLLQEALTKRNEELASVQSKNKELVS